MYVCAYIYIYIYIYMYTHTHIIHNYTIHVSICLSVYLAIYLSAYQALHSDGEQWHLDKGLHHILILTSMVSCYEQLYN